MTREKLVSHLQTLRPVLEAEGVMHLAVFGSRARGDATPASDLDLLIDAAPAARFSILGLVGVERLIEAATGIPANAVMRRSLDPAFRRSIAGDVFEVF